MVDYYNHKAIEKKILDFWESNKIPQKITRFNKKKRKFYLLDGPPYVNAEPHVGHIKTTTLKDIWSKFKSMQGFSSWFQPGFDCHGLPIENMVEKELGIISKKDIEEKIGIENFMKKCEEKARGNEKIWLELYKKLGAWRGWVKPYLTVEKYYIESAWWSFKKMVEKGMLFQGEKPTYWCPHCVEENSRILMEDGKWISIKELKNCWKKFKIIGYDFKRKQFSTQEIKAFFNSGLEKTCLLKTETGRSVIAALDHPFLVKGKGWKLLRDIKVGDKVAVFPALEMDEENIERDRVILDENALAKTVIWIELKRGKKRIGKEIVKYRDLVNVDKQQVDKKIRELIKKKVSTKLIQEIILREMKVKISKGAIYQINKLKKKNRTLEFVLKQLKEKNLIPLTVKNKATPILARLLGSIFGDGFLFFTKGKRTKFSLGFKGTEKDLQEIASDLEKIGFKAGKITKRIAVSEVNNKTIKGFSTQMKVDSISLISLLIAMGAPVGKKSDLKFEVPHWIFSSPKSIVREFLAGYFGSELEKIKLRKGKSFDWLRFVVSKEESIVNSGINFIKQIFKLLKRFEIKCGVIRKIGVVKRKDGSRSIELRGEIPGTHDNLLNFCKKIGYRYCKERSQLAAYALEYLLMIKEMEKEERKIRKKIIFLKSRGLSLTKIALKLNLTKKYVDYILYNKNKNANKLRVVSKLSSFDEWLNERIGNPHDGVIWENVKQIKPMGKKNVMDLEVVKDHNFIVNGFLTHNCQTALSGYEVTDSYEDVKDPNIYVKFQIAGKDNEYIVISTTTPWTLVSNVAIAVHPDEYYVKVKVGKEKLIISEKRIDAVLKELVKVDYEIEEKFLGKELAGLKYLPVLDVPIQEKLKSEENAHRIILSIPVLKSKSYKHGILEKYEKMKTEFFDFVNAEEGSGCVHVAPGHGPEDYYVGQHYNLPSISPIDDEGRFDTEAGEFRGMFVKEADKKVVEKLEKKNRLLYFTWVIHSYPLCWRCKSPLIFRLTKQWFLSVDLIKEKMIKESENVKWLPDFGKERFRNWLNEAVDWCISRQRYWGIPMPIWICEKCEKIEVIGSVEELRSKAKEKLPKKLNLHKHVIDKIRLVCSNCNSDMVKVPDILDVWFDSGISPWASLGYPFKNKEVFEYLWPVDLIDESQDQIRGWFYSLIFCGVSIFDESPFKTVCMNGWVLDEKGEKMSKSLGNVIWASDAIENLGSDILRFYFCWEVAPWEQQNFSFKIAEEVRKIFNILWNCYSFFLLYSSEFEFEEDNLRVEDKWILSKMNSLIKEVENNLENFEFHLAGRKIGNFILNDLSRFYIKLIRDRVWVSKKDEDKKVALTCLYKVLMSLAKILSPISPFISEEVYQNMKKFGNEKKDSVHLCAWPSHNEKLIDKDLEDKMEKVKKIIEACYSLRQREKIKLRWPVKRIFIWSEKEDVKETVEMMKDILERMCNCKEISFGKELPKGEWAKIDFDLGIIFIEKTFDEEIFNECLIREIVRKVQSMRKDYGFDVKEKIFLTLNSDEKINEILRKFSNYLEDEVGAEVEVGKIEGEIKGSLEFEDKKIEIAFRKIN